jgi:hypothetical protein
VSYSNNAGVGTATATITGNGTSYRGAVTKNFEVYGNIAQATVDDIPDQICTGSPMAPSVTVKLHGTILRNGADYQVSYSDNVRAGTATVTITGNGDTYRGTTTKSFNIYGNLAQSAVDDIPDQIYTGSPVTPAIRVKLHGLVLRDGSDYHVSYSNNAGVGTATATITGNGTSYRGAVTKTFQIIASVPMYRLYNRWSGEHLFTANADEYAHLASIGWIPEGIAWKSPSVSDTPVYRLYNPYSGDHFYTSNVAEYNYLASFGWNQEDVSFYSAGPMTGIPIYRLFNRWLTQGTHLFTTNADEYQQLGDIGWNQEGVAFYGLDA